MRAVATRRSRIRQNAGSGDPHSYECGYVQETWRKARRRVDFQGAALEVDGGARIRQSAKTDVGGVQIRSRLRAQRGQRDDDGDKQSHGASPSV